MVHQNLCFILYVSLLAITISYSPTALADKWEDGHGHNKSEEHGHSKHKKKGKHKDHHHEEYEGGNIIIGSSDRIIIRQYVEEDYRSHCPPGLAKKHNGCLPPGQAKKRYVVGQPLAVSWQPVPQPLLVQLQPVMPGYQYVQVDRDVLLISEASHKVIDAITLMSAVGH